MKSYKIESPTNRMSKDETRKNIIIHNKGSNKKQGWIIRGQTKTFNLKVKLN